MSAIRMDKLDNVGIAIDGFAKNLSNAPIRNFKIKLAQRLSDTFPHFLVGRELFRKWQIQYRILYRIYVKSTYCCDVYDFADKCSKIFKYSDENIYNNAEEVKKSISDAVIANTHSYLHPRANGLTLFFPYQKESTYDSYLNSKLDFTSDTYWDEFLEHYLG